MSKSRSRSHRRLVWALIIVASFLAVFSVMASWIQREALTTEAWTDTTTEIVENKDVQTALSTYLVDQLYANVDVPAQIKQALPPQAQALSAPAAAAARRLAQDVAAKALASPRFQALIVNASRRAHSQLLALLDDKQKFIDKSGGNVTLDLSKVVAELAARAGVDPAVLEKIQTVSQNLSQDLKAKLTAFQANASSLDQQLAALNGETLPPDTDARLATAEKNTAAAQDKVESAEKGLAGVEDKLPSVLKSRAVKVEARLGKLDKQLSALENQIEAVREQPSKEHVSELRATIAQIDVRIDEVKDKPILNQPGQLVIMKADQLDAAQSGADLLRGLGIVLPALVTLLYLLALYLAKGWRRDALIAIGSAIVIVSVVLLVAGRWIGDSLVDSLAKSDATKPAVDAIWNTLTDGLNSRIWFALSTGVLLVLAGLVAGPSRAATTIRRWLAPALRDHVVWVYVVVALLFLLRLSLIPSPSAGQIIPQLLLAALAVLGIEVLRRQTAGEFPAGAAG